ncbi:MAG: prepilin-type N-terminal cleavage/methylation domain-containing protein [Candidatus Gastranaerophilales bacterium]|nr:prepilin-type N-terminal cleavage/methylation domain-containing protein [Candidatus Gastranaerophilales bacterium]
MHTNKRIGFTLAEVLITLMIIGVISSIVIPGLINNTKEGEYQAGAKKALAELNSATKVIMVNNGGEINFASDSTFRADYCSVMNCIKIDATATNIFGTTAPNLYKSTSTGAVATGYGVILNNGMYLDFDMLSTTCVNGSFSSTTCGRVDVDINGSKAPNMWGRDLYRFYVISKNKSGGAFQVVPAGMTGDASGTTCVAGTTSPGACTYRRIYTESMP